MSAVIRVENLSKKFIIGHEETEKYTALRDVMAKKAKKIFSFPFKNANSSPRYTKEEFWALKDINFDIQQGDRVGIVGRNGAGKSTLLKILSRITEPTQGKITIKGRVASLLEVGTGFHPELTGRENIFLNGAILGMSRGEIKSKFDEIVAFAEVEKFLDTPVKRYSSGMYVRLAFAVAAHLEPEILIVDEVLAVGDAQFQKKCLGKMEDVSKNQGRTVLFVSHNMGVITQLCKHAIFLNKGELLANDLTLNVIDKYLFLGKIDGLARYVADEKASKKDIYFESITICNNGGEETDQFSFTDPVYIHLKIKINTKHPNVKVGFNLQNNYGGYVSTTVKDMDEEGYSSGPRDLNLRIKIPPSIIAPNRYSFRFAIYSDSGAMYDLLENICQIKINDTGTSLASYEGIDYGSVILDYKWEKL